MLPQDEATHSEWVAFSGDRWFTLALAEDWVRLAVLLPLSRAPPTSIISLHSFGATLTALKSSVPPWNTLLPVLQERGGIQRTAATLSARFPLSNLPVVPSKFWKFVSRFVGSLGLPRRGGQGSSSSPYTCPGPQGLLPTYSPDSGLSLKLMSQGRAGDPLPCLWGECVLLSSQALAVIERAHSASALSLVRGDNSDAHNLALGPIAFLNHACADHCNVRPVRGRDSRVSPNTGLSRSDWTGGTLTRAVPEDSPLYVSYGTTYNDGDPSEVLECPECPYPCTTRSTAAHKAWLQLQKRDWWPLAMADDWVTINLLCPMAGVSPDLVHPLDWRHPQGADSEGHPFR